MGEYDKPACEEECAGNPFVMELSLWRKAMSVAENAAPGTTVGCGILLHLCPVVTICLRAITQLHPFSVKES